MAVGAKRGGAGRSARRPAGRPKGSPPGKGVPERPEDFPPDPLTERAKAGDEEALLALVRFHSTFNPIPLSPDTVRRSSLDPEARERLLSRMKRKEDSLLRPFPAINLVFWGEPWVQEAIERLLWKRRGKRKTPDAAFLRRLWDASREGATLQLSIYNRIGVTPSAWVRVKYPHFANLGLTEAQMLKIALAEGCRFGKEEFHRAVARFRKGGR